MMLEQDTHLIQEDKPVLLIIEDNMELREYLIACLEDDYQLITAVDGKEGLDLALANVPDLIVSDVMMPIMNGYELTEILKKNEITNHIPIILLTGRDDIDSKINGIEVGADAYMTKPFNKKELFVRLKKLNEFRKTMQERFAKFQDNYGKLSATSSPQHPFLEKFYAVLEEEYENPDLNMDQLCQKIGMSRSQLFNKLKGISGKSATNILRSFRLNRGKHLLSTTDLTISEVAYQVGFNSLNYFSSSFFEEFGIRPSSFRG